MAQQTLDFDESARLIRNLRRVYQLRAGAGVKKN